MTSTHKDCPFSFGDRVEHKTSCEIGMVIGSVNYEAGSRENARLVYQDKVIVSYGFGKECVILDSLLYPVEDE